MAPPITVPFLSSNTTIPGSNTSEIVSGHVRIPYAMFGIFSLVVAAIFLIFGLKGLIYTSTAVKKRESLKQMLNPGSIANGNVFFGTYFLVSLGFAYFFLNGRDRGMSMFLFVIAHTDVLHLSKPVSAAMVTAFSLCQAAGRGLSALLSRWLTIHTMLFAQLGIACFIQLLVIFYALESEASLWVFSCLFGIISGPTYPTLMSWADRYVEATGVVIAVIDIGIGLGGFTTIITLSRLYENHGSLSVFVLCFIFSVALCFILVPLQIVSSLRGDRHKNAPPSHIIQGVNPQYNDFREPDSDDNDISPLVGDY